VDLFSVSLPAGLNSSHFLATGQYLFVHAWAAVPSEITTAIAALLVGIVVGITGMGGGALMTPALIFLGVGNVSAIITADLTAAAVYKTGGAAVHWRGGFPDVRLAGLLALGSVPMAFLGPHLVRWLNSAGNVDVLLAGYIGIASLIAAVTYGLRRFAEMHRRARGQSCAKKADSIRPVATIAIGAVGGLLVGVTSVGSGSVIMVALVMLYPTLSAVRLVGTDLLQAVPLVLSGAISNIVVNGLNWSIAIPLILGSLPGCMIGAKIAPNIRASYIRRGIVVVLTMSGLALLDKAGWMRFGLQDTRTHPMIVAGIGMMMFLLAPLVWALLRRSAGVPAFQRQALYTETRRR
jgi:uncharacterized membrane protein YfcA